MPIEREVGLDQALRELFSFGLFLLWLVVVYCTKPGPLFPLEKLFGVLMNM